ncbi:MAG: porin [Wenzhouxiangellaceae bacterium]
MKKFHLVLLSILVVGTDQGHARESERDEEIRELQQQIELMQKQLVSMQAQLLEMQAEDPASEVQTDDPATELADSDAQEEQISPVVLDQRVSNLEAVADDWLGAFKFGGAVRLNYSWRDFDEQDKDRFGDFELELFRINADGEIGDVRLSAEWRRYNDFQAIHHAWVGYEFNDQIEARVGISQVPFGILPFASHSFWFGGTYYLGLEDDYDTGVQFVHEPNDDWTFHYAFYKNPEYADDNRFGRYSFDLVTEGEQQNSEINQFNLRGERHLSIGNVGTLDLGASLQGGQIFNSITRNKGERYAIAGHANADLGPWNLQLQGLRYEFEPENPAGVDDNFVQTGAFGFPFLMAARANVYTINVARNFNASIGPITGGTCYNDFTFIDPKVDNGADSIQNVTGCSIVAGGVFAFVDWISGRNMWFAGGDGIGRSATTAGKWRSRLNVNIGFYF